MITGLFGAYPVIGYLSWHPFLLVLLFRWHGFEPFTMLGYLRSCPGVSYTVHDEIDNPFIIVVIGMGRYRVGKLTEPEEIHRRGDVEDDIGQAWTDAGIDMLFNEFRRNGITE